MQATPINSFFVRALYSYTAQDARRELSFRADQVIEILDRSASGWWDGAIDNERGRVPSTYLSLVMEDPEVDDHFSALRLGGR